MAEDENVCRCDPAKRKKTRRWKDIEICERCNLPLAVQEQEQIQHRRADIEAIPASTTPHIPGRNVTQAVAIVGAQNVQGIGIGRDFLAGVTNTFGGRSRTVERGLSEGRDEVLYELKEQANELGANGLVGVAFDQHLTAGAGGSASMLLVTATATAVLVTEGDGEF
jgi:uncharacterized protein YbjQ (UPF0145 family)